MKKSSSRPEWASQRTYIIASIASVVGLGNLWRFPYMAGENGGGTFIAAYLICILAVGLPLLILESAAGSIVDRGPVGLFQRIAGRYGAIFGWMIVAMTVTIMSYYFVVTGWTLGYFVDAVRSDIKPFNDFSSGYASVWYFLAIAAIVFLVLRRGVRSIERLGRFLLPLLVIMVFLLAVYGLTLSGGSEALAFYASFDPDLFFQPRTWQMAAGQAFYSLGVGMGVLIAYGSYIPHNINIAASGVAVTLTNSAISLTAGILVLSVAFTFNIAPDTGSQLSFTAFPKIFDDLVGGRYFAIAFFGLLFTAAFSSCYSALTVPMALLRDQFGISDTLAALCSVAATTMLGLFSALSFTPIRLSFADRPVLEMVDQITGSGIVIVLGIAGAALIAWRMSRSDLVKEVAAGHWNAGPVTFSVDAIVYVGRYMPAAALVLLIIVALL